MRLTSLSLAIVSAIHVLGSFAEAQNLTEEARTGALERMANLIAERYVHADKAVEIASELRELRTEPEVLAISDPRDLASHLTRILKRHDGHFNVTWSPQSSTGEATFRLPSVDVYEYEQRLNFGFQSIRRLAGNVGYLKMTSFAWIDTADPDDPATPVAEAAMRLISACDAVIIDLRYSGGGTPQMVGFVLSHFFDREPFVFNRLYWRSGNRTDELMTSADLRAPKMPDVPLYILTSPRTRSAAEALPYHVQAFERGTVVGERTAGAANPGGAFDAGGGFQVFVSICAVAHPVTEGNWEGEGVIPDVDAPQAEALKVAHRLALERVLERGLSDGNALEARWFLDQLRAIENSVSLREETLQAMAGSYGPYEVLAGDRQLVLRQGRQEPLRLIALGEDEFGVDGSGETRVRFARNPDGKVERLFLQSTNGRITSYNRTGSRK